MSFTNQLTEISDNSWQRGFDPLFKAEYNLWWRSSRWWKQILIWLSSVNLILFFTTIGIEEITDGVVKESVMLFCIFSGIWQPFGIMVITTSAMVSDKQQGTTSWLLSKPVSRSSFLFAKFFSYLIGFFVTMYLVPGIVAYLEFGLLLGYWANPWRMLLGIFVLFLFGMFFFSLSLMLSTFLSKYSSALGIAAAVYFIVLSFSELIPFHEYIFPIYLVIPYFNTDYSISSGIILGGYVFSVIPVIICILFCGLFFYIAFLRFRKQEF